MSWTALWYGTGRGRVPLFARVLGLRHMSVGGLRGMLLFEGTVVAALLLALAEAVPWWGAVAVPMAVAAMVKLNDLLLASLPRGGDRLRPPVARTPPAPVRRAPAAPLRVPSRARRTGPSAAVATPAVSTEKTVEILPAPLRSTARWDWRVRQSAARHYD